MQHIHYTLALLVVVTATLVCPVYSAPTTNAATGVNNTACTFNGVSDIADTYWFELSLITDGFTMATENQTVGVGAAFSKTIKGIPLISCQTYYFRACRAGSCGNTLTVTLLNVTPVPTTTYREEYYDPFIETEWNMSELSYVVPTTYFNKFGYLIWAIFWGVIFLAFWIRQEDVTMPAFLYLILFAALQFQNYLPSDFVTVSYLFAAVSLGAILYTLFRGRKHG